MDFGKIKTKSRSRNKNLSKSLNTNLKASKTGVIEQAITATQHICFGSVSNFIMNVNKILLIALIKTKIWNHTW